jgi:hypothetical protein
MSLSPRGAMNLDTGIILQDFLAALATIYLNVLFLLIMLKNLEAQRISLQFSFS